MTNAIHFSEFAAAFNVVKAFYVFLMQTTQPYEMQLALEPLNQKGELVQPSYLLLHPQPCGTLREWPFSVCHPSSSIAIQLSRIDCLISLFVD